VWGLQLDGLSPLKQNRLIKESFNSHFDTLTSFKKFRDLNESLMDVGRVYCQARKASCSICPLNKKCQAYKSGGVQTEIKTKPKKVSKYFELELGRAIVRNNKQQILMVQKGEGQWLQGQFELPTFTLKSEDQKLDQYDKIKKTTFKQKKSDAVKSSITKYKIMNFYKEVEVGDLLKWLDRKRIPSKMEWMNLDDQRIAHVSQKIIKEYRKKYE
jgi:A/G-specific adenine glycosylase